MLIFLAGCLGPDSPTAPAPMMIAPSAALIPSAADASALPINRIRAVTTLSGDGQPVDDSRFDVNPSDSEWTIDLALPDASPRAVVVVTLYLLFVDAAGTEFLQFSGVTAPITLVPGQALSPEVPIVRGVLDNLYVTGVAVAGAPPLIVEGDSSALAASVSTSRQATPDVFWTSLDSTVLRTSGAVAYGVMPGRTQLVASSGAFADTVTIDVLSNDQTAPVVVSTSPVAGAVGVPQAPVITVTFDEDLDPATVSAQSFLLADSLSVPVPGTVTYTSRVASFAPAAPLDTLHTYTASITTGIQDLAGNALAAPLTWSFETSAGVALISSVNPGLGSIVAIAFDPVSGNLFVYDDFSVIIQELTPAGTPVTPTIPHPGISSNDIDLEFLPVARDIGGTVVPGNTLLVYDGETTVGELFAVDKDDGALLSAVTTQIGSQTVGGAYHTSRGTLFGVNWSTDRVLEMDLATGDTLASFPVAPVGGPPFDVFFGDIEVDQASGNLILVSSTQNTIRVLSPTGSFIRDVDVSGAGVANMSGIAWDDATLTAWISSTGGVIYQVGGIPVG